MIYTKLRLWCAGIAGMAIGLMLVPTLLVAQPVWIHTSSEATVSMEVLKPMFDSDFAADPSFFATVTNFTVRYPVSEMLLVTAEAPISYFKASESSFNEDFAFGNPYLGLEARSLDGRYFAELGARFPVVGDDDHGVISGLFADGERMDAYLVDRWCIVGFGNFDYPFTDQFSLRARFGPIMSVYAGNNDAIDNSELFLGYGLQGWFTEGDVSVGLGYFGRAWVSESDVDDRVIDMAGVSVSLDLGAVRPGLQLRVPIDRDVADVSDFAVGLHLTAPLPER